MSVQDLCFPVRGVVPKDHGYALFGAITSLIPILHDPTTVWAPLPMEGEERGDLLRLGGELILRVEDQLLDLCRALAGKCLNLEGHPLAVGPGSTVRELRPAPSLVSSFVTGKPRKDGVRVPLSPESLGDMLARRLQSWGVDTTTISFEVGPLRFLRVQGQRVPGYPVLFEDLDDVTSLRILSEGLGGRRHFGAGCFQPRGPQ